MEDLKFLDGYIPLKPTKSYRPLPKCSVCGDEFEPPCIGETCCSYNCQEKMVAEWKRKAAAFDALSKCSRVSFLDKENLWVSFWAVYKDDLLAMVERNLMGKEE